MFPKNAFSGPWFYIFLRKNLKFFENWENWEKDFDVNVDKVVIFFDNVLFTSKK